MSTLGSRLRFIRGSRTQVAFAKSMGIPQTTLSNYENDKNKPDFGFIERISTEAGVNVDWLLFGRGEIFTAPEYNQNPQTLVGYRDQMLMSREAGVSVALHHEEDFWKLVKGQEVPAYTMNDPIENDWYRPGHLALRLSLSVAYPISAGTFAIIAAGSSMYPDGIRSGFVLFCDPLAPIEPDDAIFVMKKDGTAAVKKFLKLHDGYLHLQAWRAPDESGRQEPYVERVEERRIKQMLCVVIIKRKTA